MMARERFSVPISDIVDLLGLERNPREKGDRSSYNVNCPFCGDKKYKMNINTEKNVYHCVRCMTDSDKNTGALDLYGRVRFGTPLDRSNGKQLFHEMMLEFERGGKRDAKRSAERGKERNNKRDEFQYEEIRPAEDGKLDAVYRALIRLPYLRLTRAHAKNLIEVRGLAPDYVRLLPYASLRNSEHLVKSHADGAAAVRWYEENGIDAKRKSSDSRLKKCSRWDILAGLLIARDLMMQGYDLQGVPGFFRLTPTAWCFMYDAGMLIPTVSIDGLFVGAQIRRDSSDGLRYMTLSSKGLPGGPTVRISRTHFSYARGLSGIGPQTQVYVTEGPLKADIIRYFLSESGRFGNRDVAVIAVQGVKNVRDLPEIAQRLRHQGVQAVYESFDMDKCGNIFVEKARQEIIQIFTDAGMTVFSCFWDEAYARKKIETLSKILARNRLSFEPTGNVYYDIIAAAEVLHKHGIEFDKMKRNGREITERWDPKMKGMDDFLKTMITESA